MTNREKYAKKILDIAYAGSPISVKKGVPCKCEAMCDECDLNYGEWCEKTLQNGAIQNTSSLRLIGRKCQ